MDSFNDNNSPTKVADVDKKVLLHSLSKKLITMTQDLPELNELDYSINKHERRVTLSIGFKPVIKASQKFDLSPIFVSENAKIDPDDFVHGGQHGVRKHTHHDQCRFSMNQEREPQVKGKSLAGIPLSSRPEFNVRFGSSTKAEQFEKLPSAIAELDSGFNKPEPQ